MYSVFMLIGVAIVYSIDVPVVFEGYDLMFYWNNSAADHESPWIGKERFSYRILSEDASGVKREYDLWFRDRHNLNTFASNPWYFMPQYGGFCAAGMCCQLMPDGFWNASISKMGPPSGINNELRGWFTYDEKLYFFTNYALAKVFHEDIDTNIELADDEWKQWFGEYYKEGILNFQCYNDQNSLLKCMNKGQDWAPVHNESKSILQ